jgi:hypothetical protein
MGIIKHLALFLKRLPDLCRISYLPILHEILHSTNRFNWRLRQYLALQLPDLVALPPKPDAYRTLFPTIMTLLQDPVASVRRESFKGVSALLNAVYDVAHHGEKQNNENDESYAQDVIDVSKQNLEEICRAVNSFITSEKCQHRQLWLELALQLLKDLPKHFFEKEFLNGILLLVCDRVLNVRLACAMLLDGWDPEYCAPWEIEGEGQRKNSPWLWFLARTDIKTCVQRLSVDDNDVFLHVSRLKVVYPEIEFQSITCRGKRVAPGGGDPVPLDPTPIPLSIERTVVHQDQHKLKSRNNSIRSEGVAALNFIQEQPTRGRSSSSEFLQEHPPVPSQLHTPVVLPPIDEVLAANNASPQHHLQPPLSPQSSTMDSASLEQHIANMNLDEPLLNAKTEADDDLDEEEGQPRLANQEEIDYVASINDPIVVEELDIIDGISPGLPPRSPTLSADHDDPHRIANILKLPSMDNE